MRTCSWGANPDPEYVIGLPASTAYGDGVVVGYSPSIWYGATAMALVFAPTRTMSVWPTGATPTGTCARLIDPDPSAVKVAAGVPATRPQYTPTFSPGANPDAEIVAVLPGFPADLPTICTLADPPAVTNCAVAAMTPPSSATTVALVPERPTGMVNPAVTEPFFATLLIASSVP